MGIDGFGKVNHAREDNEHLPIEGRQLQRIENRTTNQMTLSTTQLRRHCDSFNDENGEGGVKRLAALIGISERSMHRKLSGQHKITERDERAINDAVRERDAQKAP